MPNATGLDLGSPSQKWDAFFQDLSVTGTLSTANINSVLFANQFSGATADIQINAAIAALPTNGGTIDCRGYGASTQTIAATITVGSLTKGVTLIFDRMTRFNITITNGTPAISLFGGCALVADGEVEVLSGQVGGFVLAATANVSNVIALNSPTLGGGCAIENLTIQSSLSATVTDSVVNLTNATQVATVCGLTIGAHSSTVLFKITQTSPAGSVGPINIYNLQVDGSGTAGCRPVLIQGVSGAGSMGAINFYGGTFVHPGSGGLAIIDIEGVGVAANTAGGVNFYGPYLESTHNTDIGFLINTSHGVNVDGAFFSAHAGIAGLTCFRITGISDGIAVRSADNFNGWTNNVVNTINSKTYTSASCARFNYWYNDGAGSTAANVWEDGNGVNGIIDGSGIAGKRFVTAAANPAQSGVIRLANNEAIYFRNSGNTADNGTLQYTSGNIMALVNGEANSLIQLRLNGGNAKVQVTDLAATNLLSVGSAGTVTTYNSIATVGNGVPAEYAVVDLTAQTAAIATTTLYTTPSAGQYRLSWNMKITTAAGTSSTLGPLTIVYTDPDSVAVTLTAGAQIAAGTIATSSAANTTGTVLIGLPMLLNCKTATVISYATAYASVAASAMNYNLHIVLERM